ncbi:MAG: hypothetical protein A2W08_16310 [Candidatus Rokubacteria bacterium RBG_16_73_20]|nr:MAG: hypothetical protein A2050_09255 [Candidatus Rokubacteria bacterium GWA2_73_35]OGK95493.1 MAG: hypothetical protein A2W08_16310 [Candidatus Rokubacteria bacterium RBG_16_73_20]HBH00334.1 type II toxin-antitoxin system mRNA interferase toxin, RelE/StbE family [Candidatus Rokubacteria bacterium]
MPYSIDFTRRALRELAALPKHIQQQISSKIDELAANPLPRGVQQLHGEDKLYRIRIGDYRVIYEIDHNVRVVTIATIGHRRDVYRGR